MKEEEIRKRLAELSAERRQLMDQVEDRSVPFDKQKFDDQLAAIIEEERTLKRDLAELSAPAPAPEPMPESRTNPEGGFFEVRSVEGRTSLTVGGGAAALAPENFVNEVITIMEKESALFNAVRKIGMSKAGSLGYPYEKVDAMDGSWTAEVPENDIAEDSTWEFGKRELKPNDLSKLIVFSKKLLETSAVPIDKLAKEKVAQKIRAAFEKGILTGDGDGKPLGIFAVPATASDPGIPTSRDQTAAATNKLAADDFVKAKMKLRPMYRQNAVWVMSTAVLTEAMTLKDTTGNYIWKESLAAGEPSRLCGLPVIECEDAPSTIATGQYVAALFNPQAYWFAYWKGIETQVLNEKFALKNRVGVLAHTLADGSPADYNAFVRLVMA
jgi:HK97 family phage major capsid protein